MRGCVRGEARNRRRKKKPLKNRRPTLRHAHLASATMVRPEGKRVAKGPAWVLCQAAWVQNAKEDLPRGEASGGWGGRRSTTNNPGAEASALAPRCTDLAAVCLKIGRLQGRQRLHFTRGATVEEAGERWLLLPQRPEPGSELIATGVIEDVANGLAALAGGVRLRPERGKRKPVDVRVPWGEGMA